MCGFQCLLAPDNVRAAMEKAVLEMWKIAFKKLYRAEFDKKKQGR